MAAAQASIAVPSAGKCAAPMAAEDCFAENIARPNVGLAVKDLGAGWIFRTKCDFLQVLDLLIFLQKQPGHWAEVVCIFTLLLYPNNSY